MLSCTTPEEDDNTNSNNSKCTSERCPSDVDITSFTDCSTVGRSYELALNSLGELVIACVKSSDGSLLTIINRNDEWLMDNYVPEGFTIDEALYLAIDDNDNLHMATFTSDVMNPFWYFSRSSSGNWSAKAIAGWNSQIVIGGIGVSSNEVFLVAGNEWNHPLFGYLENDAWIYLNTEIPLQAVQAGYSWVSTFDNNGSPAFVGIGEGQFNIISRTGNADAYSLDIDKIESLFKPAAVGGALAIDACDDTWEISFAGECNQKGVCLALVDDTSIIEYPVSDSANEYIPSSIVFDNSCAPIVTWCEDDNTLLTAKLIDDTFEPYVLDESVFCGMWFWIDSVRKSDGTMYVLYNTEMGIKVATVSDF